MTDPNDDCRLCSGSGEVLVELPRTQQSDYVPCPECASRDAQARISHLEDQLQVRQQQISDLQRELHGTASQEPDDLAVDRFAAAMKLKLAKKREDGRGGWEDPGACPPGMLQQMLAEHLAKGDPIDIGNFAMMIWNRGEAVAGEQYTPIGLAPCSSQRWPAPMRPGTLRWYANRRPPHTRQQGVVMSLWEIINPSDPVTIRAESLETVAVAAMALGHGMYAVEEIDGEGRKVPFFMMGGHEEWCQEQFGKSTEQVVADVDRQALADVLDSAVCGSVSNRLGYDKVASKLSGQELLDWREEYHDREVSSLNNICKAAWALADHLRAELAAADSQPVPDN